jgi:hypothetical protein
MVNYTSVNIAWLVLCLRTKGVYFLRYITLNVCYLLLGMNCMLRAYGAVVIHVT